MTIDRKASVHSTDAKLSFQKRIVDTNVYCIPFCLCNIILSIFLSLVRNFPPQLFNIISSIKKNKIIFAHKVRTHETAVSPQLGELTRVTTGFKKSTTHQTNYKLDGWLQGVRIAFLAINGALVRDDKHRSSWRRPPTTAKTAENPIMESACNYEASVSYVLPRASQHARYSNGVRERTRASALIYFASREEGVCYPFFILVFLPPSLYDAVVVASLRLYT